MNQEIKKEWLAALRSGQYKQGQGELRSEDNRFCCLGVLCDLYSKRTGVEWNESWAEDMLDGYSIHESTGILPKEITKWAELNQFDPIVIDDNEETRISIINDSGVEFAEIAKIIEAQL